MWIHHLVQNQAPHLPTEPPLHPYSRSHPPSTPKPSPTQFPRCYSLPTLPQIPLPHTALSRKLQTTGCYWNHLPASYFQLHNLLNCSHVPPDAALLCPELSWVIDSLVSHSDSVECIGLSPSFHWAATGSLDSNLVIWDIEHSSPRCILAHEEGEGVICLSWLGLSQYIATGSTDGKVRIWDSRADRCMCTFSGHHGEVESLSVTADLSTIVSVSRDHTARVFRIPVNL